LAEALNPRIKRYLLISLVAGIIAYFISFLAAPHVYVRVMIISAVEALILAPPSVMMLMKRKDSRLTALLGLLFILLMVVFVIREADAFRLGPAFVLYGPSLGEAIAFFGFFAYVIVGGIGIILLCKEKSDKALTRLAYYDEGSAALNRHGFIAEYEKAFAKAAYDNSPFIVLIAGLDQLSRLDEELGPQVADRIIRFTADSLWRLAGKDGFVGRLYGSEFIVFMRTGGTEEARKALADLDRLLGENKPAEAQFSLTTAAVIFECPACKDLDFPELYSICAPFFRKAKQSGPGGRLVATA
jgi:diguanylate cyclase (GGDEF)-like protein